MRTRAHEAIYSSITVLAAAMSACGGTGSEPGRCDDYSCGTDCQRGGYSGGDCLDGECTCRGSSTADGDADADSDGGGDGGGPDSDGPATWPDNLRPEIAVYVDSLGTDLGPAIDECDDGSVALGGYGENDWTFQPGDVFLGAPGNSADAYVARVDTAGIVLWAVRLGEDQCGGPSCRVSDVVCRGGEILVAAAERSGAILRFDLDGTPAEPLTTCTAAQITQLEEAPEGGLYIAGTTTACTLGGEGSTGPDLDLDFGAFIALRDNGGDWQWARPLQNPTGDSHGWTGTEALEVGPAGGALLRFLGRGDSMEIASGEPDEVIFAAQAEGTETDGYIARFSPSGALVSAFQLASEALSAAVITGSGELWLAALPVDDALLEPGTLSLVGQQSVLLRFTDDGALIEQHSVAVSIFDMHPLGPLPGDGIALVGTARPDADAILVDTTGVRSSEAFVAVVSAAAAPWWSALVGGTGSNDFATRVALGAGGRLLASGRQESGLTRGVAVPQPDGDGLSGFVISFAP